MMRVFKTRHFQRWMRKTELTDAALCKAVEEMAGGVIDADLGGGVVKKRVGLAGRGKRGGAKSLVFRVRLREKRPGQHRRRGTGRLANHRHRPAGPYRKAVG